MGMKLKQLAFLYLISYLAFAAFGFGLLPDQMLALFQSTGSYGEMTRMVGGFAWLLSFLLFMIYRRDHWQEFSPITLIARGPIVVLIFVVYYLTLDPMFLIINGIVIVGVLLTVIGTAMHRAEASRAT